MELQQVTEFRPRFPGHNLNQIGFYLVRVIFIRQSQPLREPPRMRIDNDGRLSECVGENGIGGLAADAGKFQQIVDAVRHLAAKILRQHGGSISY